MSLEIFLLGQFKLCANNLPIELPSRPAQSLLAYLVLNAGATLRREKLASLLWGEATESNARGYLRQALWRIRKTLESGSLRWEDYLQTSEISVAFDPQSDYWSDVDQLLKPAEGRSLEEIIEDIRFYRGELLPGFYEEWVATERDRLQAAYHQKINHLLDRLIQARRWDEALVWGEQWIRLGFSPEPAYRALIKAHAGLGNLGMVSTTYQRCVEALDRELGVDPSPETTRLYEQIRRGESEAYPSPSTPVIERISQPTFFFDKWEPRQTEKLLVVARERELKQIDNHLNLALSGQGRVIFVTGEAGSGKTTLVNEFGQRARAQSAGLIVTSGNCNAHTGIGDPYLPFREIMELLTGDIEARWSAGAINRDYAQFLWNMIPVSVKALMDLGPDLIDAFVPGAALYERARACAGSESDWLIRLDRLIQQRTADLAIRKPHQSDLFIQYSKVLQALARQAPIVLIVDDLQWADLGSISLLFHLGRYLTGSRILIVGAYRPEEITLGRAGERHPLEPVINELQRLFGDIEVNIDQAEARAFVDELLDSEPNQLGRQFREMLCQLTVGHPLFTVELLRGMQERGDLVKDEEKRWKEGPALDWETLPARIEAVIGERIGRLDPLLQTILQIASVEGELFTAEVVARVQGRQEGEILSCLSNELDRKHHLVRAQSIQRMDGQLLSGYRFRHILAQKYLYNSLDEVERVHLHERVGNVLEDLYTTLARTGMISPQLARHFQEARIPEKAIHYLQQSGDRALQVSAYQEAIAHLERGLALLATLPDSGKHIQQEFSLQLALSLAWHLAAGFFSPRTEQAAARALELGKQIGNITQLCQVLCEISILYYVKGEYQHALDSAEQAIDLAQQAKDPLLAALGHWCMGVTLFAHGDYTCARHHLEQVVSLYEPQQHHRSFVSLRGIDAGLSSLAYLACCLWCLGYPDQALQRSQQALEMAYAVNHAFSLADVLRYGCCEFHKMRRDAQSLKFNAEELIRVSQEKNFPAWMANGIYCQGAALILLEQYEEGISLIQKGVSDELSVGVHCSIPGSLLFLAEAYARLGDLQRGLSTLSQAFEMIEQTNEHHWEAELYRTLSAMQLMQGSDREAEVSLQTALEVARQQKAKFWELRAALDLAKLWQKQGRGEDGRQLVGEIYSWFTEGFDIPELKAARDFCS